MSKFKMCSFNLTQILADIQSDLSKKIKMEDYFKDVKRVAGTDISFSKNGCAIASAVIIDYHTLKSIEEKILKVELYFPYISGFLGFRESDAMVRVLKILQEDFDVLMVNGHGTLHSRGFGLASHVGLLLDVPTIGVAKNLIGRNNRQNDNPSAAFNHSYKGICNRKRCISIGHKISLETASCIVNKTSIFKMPEPIRKAHILATNTMKEVLIN